MKAAAASQASISVVPTADMRSLRRLADAAIGKRGPYTGILRGLYVNCGYRYYCTYPKPSWLGWDKFV